MCRFHFIRLGQKSLEVKTRGSKSYIADNIEVARREEVWHEVTDLYIHGLGSEMFI